MACEGLEKWRQRRGTGKEPGNVACCEPPSCRWTKPPALGVRTSCWHRASAKVPGWHDQYEIRSWRARNVSAKVWVSTLVMAGTTGINLDIQKLEKEVERNCHIVTEKTLLMSGGHHGSGLTARAHWRGSTEPWWPKMPLQRAKRQVSNREPAPPRGCSVQLLILRMLNEKH